MNYLGHIIPDLVGCSSLFGSFTICLWLFLSNNDLNGTKTIFMKSFDSINTFSKTPTLLLVDGKLTFIVSTTRESESLQSDMV